MVDEPQHDRSWEWVTDYFPQNHRKQTIVRARMSYKLSEKVPREVRFNQPPTPLTLLIGLLMAQGRLYSYDS